MMLRPLTPAEKQEIREALELLDKLQAQLNVLKQEYAQQNAAKKSVYLNRKERIAVSLLNV